MIADERKRIHENFWALGSVERRRVYILRHVEPFQPKYPLKKGRILTSNGNAFSFNFKQYIASALY